MADDIAVLGIQVDSRQAKKADDDLDKLAKTSAKTEKATDGLTGSTKKASASLSAYSKTTARSTKATDALGSATTTTTTATAGMTRAVKGATVAIVAYIGARAAGQLRQYADDFTSIENKLRQVTSSTAELNSVTAKLFDVSRRTRSGVADSVTLFQRLTLASGELNLTQTELIRLTETINKSMAISGATTAEAAGAVRQLSQGLAAGALRGDEFNSVAEQAPDIMRAIAKETGLTIGALREFAAEGGITAKIVVSALQNVEAEIDGKFNKSIATFEQKTTLATTAMIEFAGRSEGLKTTVSLAGDALIFGAEALAFFLSNLGLVSALIVARSVPSLVALAVAQRSYATATGIATIATRGFSTALSLLGGPIGLVAIAAVSLVAYVLSIDDTEKSTAALTKRTAELNAEISELTTLTQLTSRAEEIRVELEKTLDLIDEIQKKNNAIVAISGNIGPFQSELEALEATASDLSIELDVVGEKLNDVFNEGIAKVVKGADKMSASVTKVTATLKKQILFLGLSSREISEYNALHKAGVTATSALGKQIIQLNRELFDEKDRLNDIAEATKGAEKAAEDLARANEKATDEMQENWLKTRDTVAGVFEDMFDNGKDVFDDLLDGFKQMLKKMIAQAAANRVLIAIGFGGGSGSAFAGGGSGGGGFGITDIASGVSTAFKAFQAGGISGIGASLGNSVNDALVFLDNSVSGAIQGAGELVSAFGFETAGEGISDFGVSLLEGPAGANLTAAMGTALLTAAAGIAGTFVGNKVGGGLTGKEKNSDIGATIGTGVGAFFGGAPGAFIGAAIGGFVDTLFGTGKPSDKRQFATVGAGGEVLEERGLTGRKFSQSNKDAALALAQTTVGIANALSDILEVEFDKTIQARVGSRDGVFVKIIDEAGTRLLGKSKNINKALEQVVESLFDELGVREAFEEMAVSGEKLTETFDRVLVTNNLVRKAVEALGQTFEITGLAGLQASEQLIKMSGGIESFLGGISFFIKEFTPLAEQQATFISDLTDSFESLGATVPQTRAEFRLMVEALDLTTMAGREMFAALMNLAPAVATATDIFNQLENDRLRAIETRQNELSGIAKDAAGNVRSAIKEMASASKEAAKLSFDSDIDALKTRHNSTTLFLQARAQASSDRIRRISGIARGAQGALSSLAGPQTIGDRSSARGEINQAASLLRSGVSTEGLDLDKAFNTISKPSEGLFKTFVEYQRDFALTNAALDALNVEASNQLTIEEQTLDQLKSQMDQADRQFEEDKKLRSEQFDQEIDLAEQQATTLTDQLNAVLGIEASVHTVGEAMLALTNAIAQSAALDANEVVVQDADEPIPAFANGGSHSGGLRLVGEKGPELENTGSSSITSNSDLKSMLGNDAVVTEVRLLREQNRQLEERLLINSIAVRKLLERWDGDGLPAERVI
jgi:tape measure domain-containing protein